MAIDVEAERSLWQLAGLLSTNNFANQHPEEALNWLRNNAEELKFALTCIDTTTKPERQNND